MTTKVYTLFARNPDHVPVPAKSSLEMTYDELNASLAEDDGAVFE